MSPDHPQRRPKRTRKIVGKPPALLTITGTGGQLPPLDPPPSAIYLLRSWLADRCAALARWLRP